MKKTSPGYGLYRGNGDRNFVQHIKFEKAFESAPLIFASIACLDVDNEADCRVSVLADKITNSGFDLTASTWMSTAIYCVEISWIAFHSAFSTNPQGISFFGHSLTFRHGILFNSNWSSTFQENSSWL
jgi:hypothetical protein